MLNELRYRLRTLFRQDDVEVDLADELGFHLEQQMEKNKKSGMQPEEAARQARLAFGGLEQVKEECRDSRGMQWLDAASQDLRFAFRSWRKNPAFAVTVIATVALGIGVNVSIFSVVNAVLLKPLPYPDPERVVLLATTFPGSSDLRLSEAQFNVFRMQTKEFQDVSAYRYDVVNLTGVKDPEQINAAWVTSRYFSLFGVSIHQGRSFTADEDRPGGPHVVVVSLEFWQNRFPEDRQILGKSISLSGTRYEIVGITAGGSGNMADPPIDIWVPLQIDPASETHNRSFFSAGRLTVGTTIGSGRAKAQLMAEDIRRKYPGTAAMFPQESLTIKRAQDALVGDVRSSLFTLVGAVSFVLLIACANAANLLLVRATGRQREMAVRVALGGTRSRVGRQLMTESLVLSLAGGGLGLLLGMAGVRALLSLNPINIPRIGEAGSALLVDWRILGFTVLISLLTGTLFGLGPALKASSPSLSADLKDGSWHSGAGLAQTKTRSLLVAGEVALTLVLLIGASLFIRSFFELRMVQPGFDAHNVLTMRMSLAETRFEKIADMAQLVRNGGQRLGSLAGVRAATFAGSLPLENGVVLPFTIVGRPLKGAYHGAGHWLNISPDYFAVFRIPLMRGRTFTDRDDAKAPPVVLINQTMARVGWPNGNPLNAQIIIARGVGPAFDEPPRQIVGIVGDVRDDGLNRNPASAMYIPASQVPAGLNAILARFGLVTWAARTEIAPKLLRPAIQRELREASGGLPVGNVRSMEEVIGRSTARQGFNTVVLTVFASSALLLSAVGIYGLVAYYVRDQTRETGIRLALGAEPKKVRNETIIRGMRLVLVGIVTGIVAAFGLTRLLTAFLFRVRPLDAVVFMAAPVVLAAVALLACYLPARRAARINPLEALRWE